MRPKSIRKLKIINPFSMEKKINNPYSGTGSY
jgi:hypothetical protein